MAKLEKISNIDGRIFIKTGLHIGGGTESIEIGGIDNPVIKEPMSGHPFIPGSSLKGKMRSLLEQKHGIKSKEKDKPCTCGDCDICMVFGNTSKDSKVGVTRAIFRDIFLADESKEMLKERNMLATEAKTENTINRITGTALNPRTTERVIAGLYFDLKISLRIFENDGDSSIKLLKDGLKLVENDALGGSTSRGYGRVEFRDLKIDGEPISLEG